MAAVTGGGEHPLGVNIVIERDDESHGQFEPPASGSTDGGARGRAARVAAHLRAGCALSPVHDEAVEAIAAGGATITVPPGRGAASLLACGAAAVADGRRCALVVTPLRHRALHRSDQIRARVAPLGLRVHVVHGLQDVRDRERVDAALRAGDADIVVATWEVLAGGWAEQHRDRLAAVVCDGAPSADLAPHLARVGAAVSVVNTVGSPNGADLHAAVRTADGAVRTGLRLVDRRGAADADAIVEEVAARNEKCVVYACGRETCVQLARRLRERSERGPAVAYLHRGLPARVRQTIVQAFRESRIGVLVTTPALDEEALPEDVRHVVLAALPPDRTSLAEVTGILGFEERPVIVTALFGADGVRSREETFAARAPDRPLLASLYRTLIRWRGDQPVAWPDDATWDRIRGALPGIVPGAVEAAFVIFEEAGLASREVAGAAMEIRLLSTPYRELGASLRYREGRRERAAFEDCARWALRASPLTLLQALAARPDGSLVPPPLGVVG